MNRKSALRHIRSPSITFSILFLLFIFALSVIGPYITVYDPFTIDLRSPLKQPDLHKILGTDELGRDVLSRIILGGRISLLVGFAAITSAAIIGTAMGLLAGFYGGVPDSTIMRLVDIFLSFPAILLALALVVALGTGPKGIILALIFVYWTSVARVVRGKVLSIKTEEFIQGARAIGVGDLRIMAMHVLPNCVGEIAVISTLSLGRAIVAEASLSFLGLGIQVPNPSWGNMLNSGINTLRSSPHLVLFPGIAIFGTVLAINILGDTLRDWFDPKSSWGGGLTKGDSSSIRSEKNTKS